MSCALPITAHLVLHVFGHEGPEAHECEHVEDGGEVVGHVQLVGQQPHQGGLEVILQWSFPLQQILLRFFIGIRVSFGKSLREEHEWEGEEEQQGGDDGEPHPPGAKPLGVGGDQVALGSGDDVDRQTLRREEVT